VRLCEERGLGPDAVTPALLDEAAQLYHGQPAGLTAAQIREALDPGRFIADRTMRGGPAPKESQRQIGHFAAGLEADEAMVSGIHQRLADSARKLDAAVDALIGR
jgi:argininosuccinate lyase